MAIKMLVGISGADFSLSPNDETSRFSADEEGRMVEAGMAVRVGAAETATKTKPAGNSVKGKVTETRG